MIAMRNVLVHRYGSVDAAIVWDIVNNKLPVVLERLIPLTPATKELRRRLAPIHVSQPESDLFRLRPHDQLTKVTFW